MPDGALGRNWVKCTTSVSLVPLDADLTRGPRVVGCPRRGSELAGVVHDDVAMLLQELC